MSFKQCQQCSHYNPSFARCIQAVHVSDLHIYSRSATLSHFLSIYADLYIYIYHIYIYLCMYVCMYVCVYVCMYSFMYVYVYVYVYVYYMYMYMYMYIDMQLQNHTNTIIKPKHQTKERLRDHTMNNHEQSTISGAPGLQEQDRF
jgi:hypothetical protein